MKILFFIESLNSGGKERRFVELISFLKTQTNIDCLVVLTRKEIHYQKFHTLNVPYIVIERKHLKKDPRLFHQFYKICKTYQPDLIHTWGSMVTFYALPAKIIQNIPLINSQITDVPSRRSILSFDYFISNVSFFFSNYILSNSKSGLKAYNIHGDKSSVIYNGIDTLRTKTLIEKELIKSKYLITSPYSVVMVANYSSFKKNQLFVDVANYVLRIREDISFISLGGGDVNLFEKVKLNIENKEKVLLLGKSNEVESIVNASDIGVLFTNGEGISNSIMEYMLLGKPVIAHKYGGTEELIDENVSGYLLANDNVEHIANLIMELIDNKDKRKLMGEMGKQRIHKIFTIEHMGIEFEKLYHKVLSESIKVE
ncbi:MAG: glycosyltransferase [Bacteroidota bacterium]